MKPVFAKRCQCGAVTVHFNEKVGSSQPTCESSLSVGDSGTSYSIPEEYFQQHFAHLIDLEESEFYNCDYCVNNWGIDLCGCGSGEKVGECDNDFVHCRENIPAQILEL
jgi:hypothetical protein